MDLDKYTFKTYAESNITWQANITLLRKSDISTGNECETSDIDRMSQNSQTVNKSQISELLSSARLVLINVHHITFICTVSGSLQDPQQKFTLSKFGFHIG